MDDGPDLIIFDVGRDGTGRHGRGHGQDEHDGQDGGRGAVEESGHFVLVFFLGVCWPGKRRERAEDLATCCRPALATRRF